MMRMDAAPHGERQIGFETGDAGHLHPRRGLDLELRHHRAGRHSDDAPFDAEGGELVDQRLAEPLELLPVA